MQRSRSVPAGLALLALITGAVLNGCTSNTSARRHTDTTTKVAPPGSTSTSQPASTAPSHIFVVLMENLDASAAMAVPSIAALAHQYQWTTNWYAIGHPSLPNYLALASGSTWGVTSDCTTCLQSGPDLGSQLSAAGVSWDAYFEGMPSPCFLGPQSSDASYAQKHDPFAYFTDIRSSPALCAHLQPLDALNTVLAGPASAAPRFVWVTPNLCHSGHDCSPAVAGAWLSSFVAQVTASAAWHQGGALFVTWDEGVGDAGLDPVTGTLNSGGGGAVLTIAAVEGAPSGRQLAGPFDHYSLLRFVETALGVPALGAAADAGVPSLAPFFAPAAAP